MSALDWVENAMVLAAQHDDPQPAPDEGECCGPQDPCAECALEVYHHEIAAMGAGEQR